MQSSVQHQNVSTVFNRNQYCVFYILNPRQKKKYISKSITFHHLFVGVIMRGRGGFPAPLSRLPTQHISKRETGRGRAIEKELLAFRCIGRGYNSLANILTEGVSRIYGTRSE